MEKTSPLISVVIPTYNSAPYVERCLNSVINQSIKNIEIILVDDMSSDHTPDILCSYANQFENIKLLKMKTKKTAGAARNVGIENSKGKYISFIDSDDWIDSDYYHHMLLTIKKDNTDIAISGVKREYENHKNSSVRYKYNSENIITGEYAITLLSRVIDQDISISSIVCNKLFRAKLIRGKGHRFIEKCNNNEDDIFTFNIFLDAKKVGINNKTNYHQYQRRGSVSRNFTKKHIDDLFFAFECISKTLKRRNLYKKYKLHYYAFFEKCLSYLLEAMRLSEQDESIISGYLVYAYLKSKNSIPYDEFIEYCGSKRIESFFRTS